MDRKMDNEGEGASALVPSSLKIQPKDDEFQETLSQKGAMALAKRLEQFWHAKGFTAARFWAEPIGERFEKVGSYEIYRVVSNLVNGLPPRYQ